MASNNSNENEGQKLMFKAKNTHFFKIILEDNLREGKLPLPKMFVRKYGSDLSNSVLLKVPSGAVWQIGLIKCDNEIWLVNGWRDFVKYYSIATGHFLVFEHVKSFGFHVLIFDISALEIDYRYSLMNNIGGEELHPDRVIKKSIMKRTEKDVVSFDIMDDSFQNRKNNVESLIQCSRPQKIMKNNPRSDELEIKSKLDSLVSPNAAVHSGGDKPEKSTKIVNSKHSTHQTKENGAGMEIFTEENKSNEVNGLMKRMEPLTENEKQDALQRASTAFISENPFFILAMQPSHIHQGRLTIPSYFVTKYFGKKHGNGILYSLDGRSWPVQFCNVGNKGQSSVKITNGWKKFTEDNLLKVGDVCLFELLHGSEISMKVAISRVDGDADQSFSRDGGCLDYSSLSSGPKTRLQCSRSHHLESISKWKTSTPLDSCQNIQVKQENLTRDVNPMQPSGKLQGDSMRLKLKESPSQLYTMSSLSKQPFQCTRSHHLECNFVLKTSVAPNTMRY